MATVTITQTDDQLITLEKITLMHSDAQAASQASRDANERRDKAVLLGVESGIRQADIAAALSLTPGRVSQIVTRAAAGRESLAAL